MRFKISGKHIECKDAFKFNPPSLEAISQWKIAIDDEAWRSKTIPEAISRTLRDEVDEWLKLAICLCHVRYSYTKPRQPKTTEAYLKALFYKPEPTAENATQSFFISTATISNQFLSSAPEEFKELVREMMETIDAFAKNFFQIGSAWVKYEDVCKATPPTDQDKWSAYSILGLSIESGVPILEALDLAGESSPHPWMKMIFSLGRIGIIEGDSLGYAIMQGIKTFEWKMFKEYFLVEEGRKDKFSGSFVYYVPNFIATFGKDLSLFDGKESARIFDEILLRLAKDYAASSSKPWSADINTLFRDLATYQFSGTPILKALKLAQESLRYNSLADDIQLVCDEIETGACVSEGFAGSGSQLATPEIVGFLRCGERANKLDRVFEYMSS